MHTYDIYIRTDIHIYIYTHTYTHIHTHLHIYIYAYTKGAQTKSFTSLGGSW